MCRELFFTSAYGTPIISDVDDTVGSPASFLLRTFSASRHAQSIVKPIRPKQPRLRLDASAYQEVRQQVVERGRLEVSVWGAVPSGPS